MSKLAIVTDSTSGYPHSTIGNIPVFSVPLAVVWDDVFYQDGIDLKPDEFYRRLKKSRTIPKTHSPSPKAFLDVYKKLINQGYDVLSIHLSAKISETIDSAFQAKKILRNPKSLEILDSYTLSLGSNLLIQAVGEQANNGATFEECIAFFEEARLRCRTYCTVRDMKYLIRGGRVSGLAGGLARLAGLRPILALEDGEIVAKNDKLAFSAKQARKRIIQLVLADLENQRLDNLAAAYTDDRNLAIEIMKDVSEQYGLMLPDKAIAAPLSPVIGTHTGPGSFGIATLFRKDMR